MRRRAPLREPDMLTSSKRGRQAQKFPQGGGVLTSGNPNDQELRWLTFLFWNLRSIAPFRHQIEDILSHSGGEPPKPENEFSLLLG